MNFFKNTKFQVAALIVLFCLILGVAAFISSRAFQEPAEVVSQHIVKRSAASRNPASIQKVFDYSYLQGEAFQTAAKQRLLSSISISQEDHNAVIEIGNFVMLNDDNQKDFACGYYDQVEMTFNAEGVAISGEKPVLTVASGCEVGDNINNLNPIRLPVDKLKAMEPGNSQYKFYDSKSPLTVQFSNPPPEWPKKWQLTEVKLTSSQHASRVLHLTTQDFQQTGNIMMNW